METVSPYLGARVAKGIRTGITTTGMAITRSRAAIARLMEQKFGGYGLKRGFFRSNKPPVNLDAALDSEYKQLSADVEEKKEGLTGFTDPSVHQRPGAGPRKAFSQWQE